MTGEGSIMNIADQLDNSMLTVFEKEGIVIRTVQVAGEAHFVAADLAEPLGIRNIRDKVAQLDDDEKGVGIIDTVTRGKQKHTGGWEFKLKPG